MYCAASIHRKNGNFAWDSGRAAASSRGVPGAVHCALPGLERYLSGRVHPSAYAHRRARQRHHREDVDEDACSVASVEKAMRVLESGRDNQALSILELNRRTG